MKRESSEPPDPAKPGPEKSEVEREALIDEILEGTFPASDPPTWDGVADLAESQETPSNPDRQDP